LIGAGGGASAVVTQLAQEGAKNILIYDIDKNKTLNLVNRLKLNFPNLKDNCIGVDNISELNIKNCDLLINTTPIGLKESDPCLVDGTMINPKVLVYDLIYNPAETKLLKAAKQAGAKVSNGLGMLLYQGTLSFEYFTGKKAPVEIMWKALKEAIKKL
jgi:shikimate dehydrogenase